jgi:hypothetical protein
MMDLSSLGQVQSNKDCFKTTKVVENFSQLKLYPKEFEGSEFPLTNENPQI